MSNNPSNNQNQSDEIDLGQLFTMIGKGFNSFFKGLLFVFVYLRKNIFWLGGLVIAGAVWGYILNQLVDEKQQLDVIVTPNLETKSYLYDAVAEIQAEIKAKDTAFFRKMGMDMEKMQGFELEINPLRSEDSETFQANDKILELLKDFDNTVGITDILREELKERAIKEHRIKFFFIDADSGSEYAKKIVDYINSNPFYNQLLDTYRANALQRIKRNDSLVLQLDRLIDNYTNKLAKEQQGSEGRLVLDNQEALDVPSLFELKNQLIRDTEAKKLDLEMKKSAITIVNFGNPYTIQKAIFRKNIILFPLLFLAGFFLVAFIRFLNRKAKEMQIG
jgi:hypothetical protein